MTSRNISNDICFILDELTQGDIYGCILYQNNTIINYNNMIDADEIYKHSSAKKMSKLLSLRVPIFSNKYKSNKYKPDILFLQHISQKYYFVSIQRAITYKSWPYAQNHITCTLVTNDPNDFGSNKKKAIEYFRKNIELDMTNLCAEYIFYCDDDKLIRYKIKKN